MRKFTIKDLRKLKLCFDPTNCFDENYEGTLLDILGLDSVTPHNRICVVTQLASTRVNRLFAVHCANQAMGLVPPRKVDERSLKAIEVAENFAIGKATSRQLYNAGKAAYAVYTEMYNSFNQNPEYFATRYKQKIFDIKAAASFAAYKAAHIDLTKDDKINSEYIFDVLKALPLKTREDFTPILQALAQIIIQNPSALDRLRVISSGK